MRANFLRTSISSDFKLKYISPVFCPCQSALVGLDHHSAKKVLILTKKLWKMKKVVILTMK
jgi:hypothetical protein